MTVTDELQPDVDSINRPFWEGLAEGKLLFQACRCGHRWLPARAFCPACLKATWTWQAAIGRGRIRSGVVYHHAYHPAFKDRLPYNVALVELEEGPRLLTNILAPNDALRPGADVRLAIDIHRKVPLAVFELVEGQAT